MGLLELLLIAVGLSMDAVAVSICQGLSMKKASLKKALVVGLYFGIFQALMPLAGYLVASQFAELIESYDHWIALIVLAFIGIRMIIGSFKKNGCPDRTCPDTTCSDRQCPRQEQAESSLKPKAMLPLAVATSIDALAVGVSFAVMHVEILPAIALIGACTLALSMAGVKIGSIFGSRLKSKAELVGGVILVLIGLKIFLEHMGILAI